VSVCQSVTRVPSSRTFGVADLRNGGPLPFLLSDVLHCTNMNTDMTDFRKKTYCINHLINLN